MKIFITGGNGYIGSRVARMLLRRGHAVTCMVRDPAKASALREMGATLVQGDVTGRESMRAAMQGSDAVFHLAGQYTIGRTDRSRMRLINVDGARHTLELAAELGVPRILHTSTVGVFGNTHGRIVDESFRAPKTSMASEYERTKWEAHYEVAVPLQQQGAPVMILQPGGTTGPADTAPHRMLFDFFLNRTPMMLGPRAGVTFAHVDDIAEGHALALERGKPGEAYILCGPAQTYRQVLDLCGQITGITAPRIWGPGWLAAGLAQVLAVFEGLGAALPVSSEALAVLADYTFWATADKARKELSWSPRPVEQVLREVMEYELKQRGRGSPRRPLSSQRRPRAT